MSKSNRQSFTRKVTLGPHRHYNEETDNWTDCNQACTSSDYLDPTGPPAAYVPDEKEVLEVAGHLMSQQLFSLSIDHTAPYIGPTTNYPALYELCRREAIRLLTLRSERAQFAPLSQDLRQGFKH